MTAVNATCGKMHSVLLDVVNALGRKLGEKTCVVESIRFAFVVPWGAEFQVGDVQGRLSGWKNLEGVQWPNHNDKKQYGNFIVVADIASTGSR